MTAWIAVGLCALGLTCCAPAPAPAGGPSEQLVRALSGRTDGVTVRADPSPTPSVIPANAGIQGSGTDAALGHRTLTPISFRHRPLHPGRALIVLDGRVLGRGDSAEVQLRSVDPHCITVERLQGPTAAARFGKEGRHGVLLLRTGAARP